jgi:hypothetical protein
MMTNDERDMVGRPLGNSFHSMKLGQLRVTRVGFRDGLGTTFVKRASLELAVYGGGVLAETH